MIITSGDIFFALVTFGAAGVFGGLGLLLASVPVRRKLLAGVGLLAAGALAIVAPMMGAANLVERVFTDSINRL